MTYQEMTELMTQYPDIWKAYLDQLSTGGGGNIQLSDILADDFNLSTPRRDQDPWYMPGVGYTSPSRQQEMGYQNPNQQSGMTINDLMTAMGQGNNIPGLEQERSGVGGTPANPNYTYGQDAWKQEDADWYENNKQDNWEADQRNSGGGNTGTGKSGTSDFLKDPSTNYQYLFDPAFIRSSFTGAMDRANNLQPMSYTPWNYQAPATNPIVDRTMQDVMNRTVAYRGAR